MEIIYLDVELMEQMCHPLAVAFFDDENDPIPAFHYNMAQLLDSALHAPRHTFGRVDPYPTLVDKAAILYYSLIQNHPFPNGNKRIATASLLVFLYINNHWLEVDNEELAKQAIRVADSVKSRNDFKTDSILDDIKNWIKQNIKDLDI